MQIGDRFPFLRYQVFFFPLCCFDFVFFSTGLFWHFSFNSQGLFGKFGTPFSFLPFGAFIVPFVPPLTHLCSPFFFFSVQSFISYRIFHHASHGGQSLLPVFTSMELSFFLLGISGFFCLVYFPVFFGRVATCVLFFWGSLDRLQVANPNIFPSYREAVIPPLFPLVLRWALASKVAFLCS